jgi:hypothetical protein
MQLKEKAMGFFLQNMTLRKMYSSIYSLIERCLVFIRTWFPFDGDPVFNGNPDKWMRTVNVFTLRVLNMLSKKVTVGGMNVQQIFEEMASKPLIESEADSYQRVYNANKSSQWYPFYYEQQNYWSYQL